MIGWIRGWVSVPVKWILDIMHCGPSVRAILAKTVEIRFCICDQSLMIALDLMVLFPNLFSYFLDASNKALYIVVMHQKMI